MIPEVATRIGIYWSVSALLFAFLAILAARRVWHFPTRYRAAILVFATMWTALCAENAAIRFGWLGLVLADDPFSEALRAACCLSLIGLIVEWRPAPTADASAEIAALRAINAELTRRLGMSVEVE